MTSIGSPKVYAYHFPRFYYTGYSLVQCCVADILVFRVSSRFALDFARRNEARERIEEELGKNLVRLQEPHSGTMVAVVVKLAT